MSEMKPKASQPGAPSPAAEQGYDLQACMLKSRRVSKLSAAALLTEFASTVAHDRGTTVDLLIQIGEIEERRLYLGHACADMYAYCTDVLHMSESTASRRIRSAHAARQYPVILPMIAEGKLHLSAVSLLSTHLKPHNAALLLAEATHKSKAEVELILSRRFPKSDVPESVRALTDPNATSSPTAQVVANIAAQLSPVTVVPISSRETAKSTDPLCAGDESRAVREVVSQVVTAAAAKCGAEVVPQAMLADIADAVAETIVNAAAAVLPASAPPGVAPARVTPRSAGRFAWQLTADQEMQDLLEEARNLSGRAEARDLSQVLKRGLKLLVEALRKSRRAETSRPQSQRGTANARHVPAALVRDVWKRDGQQCTFTAPDGRRCGERSGLEIDHVIPLARGGKATLDNLRLLCGPHNQHEAERVLGVEHMQAQRETARARAEGARAAMAERNARAARKASREIIEPARAGADSQAPPTDGAERGGEHMFPK